jgi:YtcA-like protein
MPILLSLILLCLGGCSNAGAPSFEAFGAFFPAWMMCGAVGILGAVVTRVVLVSTSLAVVPYRLLVCTAVGLIAAILFWLPLFGW